MTVHHALFVLLPLMLAARMIIPPRPAGVETAHGVLRFCLGFAKWALLISPLWQLSSMVLKGGPQSLSGGVAWMGLLALVLAVQFAFTGAGDVIAGLGGMLGFKVPDSVQEIFTLRRLTQRRWLILAPLLLGLSLAAMLLQTLSFQELGPLLKALFAAPARSVATVFQEARVWSDYHVVTMIGGLSCLIGLPHSRDFVQAAAPWKAAVCFSFFVLGVAVQWTRNTPM